MARLQRTIQLLPSRRQRSLLRKTLQNFRKGVQQVYRMGVGMNNFTRQELQYKIFYRPVRAGENYNLKNNLGLSPSLVAGVVEYVAAYAMQYPGQEPNYRDIPMKLDMNTLTFIDSNYLQIWTVEGPITVKYREGPAKEAQPGTERNQGWLISPTMLETTWNPAYMPPVLPDYIAHKIPVGYTPHRSTFLPRMENKIDQINNTPTRSEWFYQRRWQRLGGRPYYQPGEIAVQSQVNPALGGKWLT